MAVRNVSFAAVVVALAGLSAGAWAQNAEKGAAKAGEKAGAKQPEGMPAMDAEQAKMMEAWMKAAAPGEMHTHLQKSVGVWEGQVKMWMDPSAPPQESTCTTVITSTMGGRFTRSETKGTMMGMPFEGFGVYGYNNTTKKFESTWCDNLGTMMMNFTGEMAADGKSITWNAKFMDPATGQESFMREVEKHTGENTMVLEMYGPGPDGKEAKMMEINYKRQPGTGASSESKGAKKDDHAGHGTDKKK